MDFEIFVVFLSLRCGIGVLGVLGFCCILGWVWFVFEFVLDWGFELGCVLMCYVFWGCAGFA